MVGRTSEAEIAERVEAALAIRDAVIAKREQRVRVLERVVTDGSARIVTDRLRA
jgi:hypothetical protein